ncbi:thiopeptide-type bacteriocin biosynthesis protein [Streptomyces sp. NPDC014735]|uniref:thiopeptide-type bacteriocin biosynthesis protein n=1 Tax=unclassified Streptomyces TaxID=2593676 RepID=UPI0036FA6DAA
MEPANLADAVEIFQQAGRDAVARHTARSDWWQVYVEFSDWATAEQTTAVRLVPLLRRAGESGGMTEWWFTRKHPCWRLRLYVRPETGIKADLRAGLDRLTAEGHLRRWWPGIYEPEIAPFGGPAGMLAAHALFSADSRQIIDLAVGRTDMQIGRRELSVLLCTAMMRAAGLEWYEQGDVWQRVIDEEHRSALDAVPGDRLQELAAQLRSLLVADTSPGGPLLSHGGPMEPVSEWADAFRDTGQALHEAVRTGTLERGLRRVLSLHVIFHWNRLGLSMGTQSALAWAARTAILDPRG